MQNQLDGVQVGLKQLETCLTDVKNIVGKVKEVDGLLTTVPEIYDALEPVRDENIKHSQYATAMENLKHIFNVQSSVEKTTQLIDEDKLLNAHQCLAELKRHFEKVETVSKALEKKIRLVYPGH